MTTYATRAQFYALGLSPAACTPESRSLSAIHLADSVFELPGHGWDGGESIRFVALGEDAALCAGLSGATLYDVDVIGPDLFRVNLLGVPVVITDVGAGVVAVVEDITRKIDMILEANSSYVDANAKAYKPPFKPPYPKWVTRAVCKLSALDVALVLRRSNPSYDLTDVKEEAAKIEAFLATLAKGAPTADDPADQSEGVHESAARGWKRAPKDDMEAGL